MFKLVVLFAFIASAFAFVPRTVRSGSSLRMATVGDSEFSKSLPFLLKPKNLDAFPEVFSDDISANFYIISFTTFYVHRPMKNLIPLDSLNILISSGSEKQNSSMPALPCLQPSAGSSKLMDHTFPVLMVFMTSQTPSMPSLKLEVAPSPRFEQ